MGNRNIGLFEFLERCAQRFDTTLVDVIIDYETDNGTNRNTLEFVSKFDEASDYVCVHFALNRVLLLAKKCYGFELEDFNEETELIVNMLANYFGEPEFGLDFEDELNLVYDYNYN